MARDWNKSNTEYVRQLWLMPDTDLDAVGKTLSRVLLVQRSIQTWSMISLASLDRPVLSRDVARALKASQLAGELYPEAPQVSFIEGIAWIVNKDNARALPLLKKSAALNPSPNGPASAGGLNSVAYEMAGAGMIDEAITLEQMAIEMYPKEANLYDSFGEFQLRKGEKAKALASYKKALETDASYPNASVAKELVQKLTNELAANPAKP
jgi:tetratricopeptide (TPR) repeat protein